MGWDGFQREMLAALGHQVYAVAQPTPPSVRDDGDAQTSPLLSALARAAGVPISALPPLPPVAQLRTPAAKRALWPVLRTLHRNRQS